jgi:predicted SnoaL-like aldol condensation-catalyzing enzyme
MITSQKAKEGLLHWLEAVNSNDLSVIDRVADEFFTADYVWHAPGFTGRQPGPAGVKSILRDILGWNPNMKVTLVDLFAEGDKVAARFTLQRTDPATGKTQHCLDLSLTRFVGDKTAEEWELIGPWEDEAIG